MEVRIRLQKASTNSKKVYNYRIVAICKTNKRDGRNLEILGHYDPAKKPATLMINEEKLEKWVEKGAQMSDTVRSLLKGQKKAKAAK
jgi:small subunit ribosomal protein S16